MKIPATLLLSLSTTAAFTPSHLPTRQSSTLYGTTLDKVTEMFKSKPAENEEFGKLVRQNFPGALSNRELAVRVVELLEEKGMDSDNTLLCTSLCADELARVLEDEFVGVYGNNFNLGGLSGFPFAGNTGWGAMSAHVPDGGYNLVIHGPHVGITKDGVIGKVERSGIALVDNCCGSAIAASNYLKGITDGGANITPKLQQFSDFQQGAVQELILPFGKRLSRADNRMRELPYALYDSQQVLVDDIVNTGKGSIKAGLAVLGGIQINTGPDTCKLYVANHVRIASTTNHYLSPLLIYCNLQPSSTVDYFHPLRFDYYDADGNLVDNMLPYLK